MTKQVSFFMTILLFSCTSFLTTRAQVLTGTDLKLKNDGSTRSIYVAGDQNVGTGSSLDIFAGEGSDASSGLGGNLRLSGGSGSGWDNPFGKGGNVEINGGHGGTGSANDAGDIFLGNVYGNVGISTNKIPAGYKLAVNGKIICTELKVQLKAQWPDYVFAKNYRLTSFDNLRKFIAAHRHLPGVPAASEMKEGIQVGELVNIQMKKIEELTLYILQLESRLKALEIKK